MIPATELDGFVVLTAINRRDGEATSETYALKSVREDSDGTQHLIGTSEDGDDYEVMVRPIAAVPEEVEPYRGLIQALIAADSPCPGFACSITTLGHLLLECSPEQVDLVRALDPSQPS